MHTTTRCLTPFALLPTKPLPSHTHTNATVHASVHASVLQAQQQRSLELLAFRRARPTMLVPLTSVFLLSFVAAEAVVSAAPPSYLPTWKSLDSRINPSWYTTARFGIKIHWGPYAVPGWGPIEPHYAHSAVCNETVRKLLCRTYAAPCDGAVIIVDTTPCREWLHSDCTATRPDCTATKASIVLSCYPRESFTSAY